MRPDLFTFTNNVIRGEGAGGGCLLMDRAKVVRGVDWANYVTARKSSVAVSWIVNVDREFTEFVRLETSANRPHFKDPLSLSMQRFPIEVDQTEGSEEGKVGIDLGCIARGRLRKWLTISMTVLN